MESGRTFGYLLVFALALCYLTDGTARRAFRYFLMAGVFVVLAASVQQLLSGNVSGLFIQNRFSFPVSYANNAAALFLIGFWPLMWLAASREERAPVRGIALGLATGSLGLAIMTQSRGAIWSLGITLVLTFLVSPARMRTLFYLIVPGLLTVYQFPALDRYWTEGPDVVGGGLAARTILVASITAAFIGCILALLERWVRVSTRMKVIFGAIAVLGAVAALTYGTYTLSSDVGGPFNWASQAWRQFTGQEKGSGSESESTTRLTIVSSSGRVDIWRVAWKEFQGSPLLGVGADNFVYQYDRMRTLEAVKPQQAHSLELQILGETGILGGVFAFGGILLALGGILWPRCAAGWHGARATWLRRRRGLEAAGGTSRWGKDPTAYGWEMALLVGLAYWLIHASVDWLWQMAGVSIAALLLLAAGLAGVDASAELMWPRWHRWLRLTRATLVSAQADIPDERPTDEYDCLFMHARRSDRSSPWRRRRQRRRDRKEKSAHLLQPSGTLSVAVRTLLVTLSLVVIIIAGLPYLSLQYQKSALALAKTDGVRAVARAATARWLQPSDPGPYLTQAGIYASAASAVAASDAADRAGATLDNLGLSIASLEQAAAHEPADWSIRYQAGVAALNLLLATDCVEGRTPPLDYATLIPLVPGIEDWSTLSGTSAKVMEPGKAVGSLAATVPTQESASRYRNMSLAELSDLARTHLEEARERNPLATQVGDAMSVIGKALGQ